jgi:hypothetical protein
MEWRFIATPSIMGNKCSSAQGGRPPSPMFCDGRLSVRNQPTTTTNKKGNNQMKLTKTQIKEKRAELVSVLLKIEKLKDEKTSIEKTLAPDFEVNEAAYRNGVATENGILIRKASWKCTAKPIVEAA